MRKLIFCLLSLYSLSAFAAKNWQAFPYEQSSFDYQGDALRQAWPKLTRGFGPDYPFPDATWVMQLCQDNPKVFDTPMTSNRDFACTAEGTQIYASKVQNVWRLLFRGDFAQTKVEGLKLGAPGKIPATFAQIIHALFLAPRRGSRHHLLEQAIIYLDESGEFINNDRVSMFARIFAKARLAEELPIGVVLKRGYTQEIPKELDALLLKQRLQPYALAMYGGYHAGIIRKVGQMVGGMTYDADSDRMEQFFQRSFAQANDMSITHYEYANALSYVYGDDEYDKALAQLQLAVSIKPINAIEALEVAQAKKLLASFEQRSAQR
jgi:hypothetical protein